MFIDNLPKDEKTLKELLKVVESEILLHEKKFFEDEDSETEHQLMSHLMNPNITIKEHSDCLEQFK